MWPGGVASCAHGLCCGSTLHPQEAHQGMANCAFPPRFFQCFNICVPPFIIAPLTFLPPFPVGSSQIEGLRVVSVHIYPVKSCKGIRIPTCGEYWTYVSSCHFVSVYSMCLLFHHHLTPPTSHISSSFFLCKTLTSMVLWETETLSLWTRSTNSSLVVKSRRCNWFLLRSATKTTPSTWTPPACPAFVYPLSTTLKTVVSSSLVSMPSMA